MLRLIFILSVCIVMKFEIYQFDENLYICGSDFDNYIIDF